MESFEKTEAKQKSKQMKTKENKKYKHKYCGGKSSNRNKKNTDATEALLKDKYKINVKKSNEIT